jgi:hypothetical protein
MRKEARMQSITKPTKQSIAEQIATFWLLQLTGCEDVQKHLAYVEESAKELKTEALRLELGRFDEMLAKEVPGTWRFKEYRRRTIITLAGKITYLRRIYQEPSGICHALLDEVLGIRTRFKLAPDAFLWIARCAADISFRKTAAAFFERTGVKISHWLVMAVVHEEGALLLEESYRKAFCAQVTHASEALISQEVLFVEFDGIHIPLQKTGHEPLKKRWAYEQNRHRHTFELKCAVAYAGKDKRGRRGCPVHFAADAPPAFFWPLLNARIASVYDTDDVSCVHSFSDAAAWCKQNELDVMKTASEATHHIDRFHLNREIRRAFGGKTGQASHFISLAYTRRTKRLMRDLQLVINHAKDKSRYLCLQTYLTNNLDLIKAGIGPSAGTMEGTNAHVYAARLKVWGGAWSRRGASAMAAVRARLASGEDLIAPKIDNALLDDSQIRRRLIFEEGQLSGKWNCAKSEGFGYVPPQGSIILSTHMAPNLYGWLYCP